MPLQYSVVLPIKDEEECIEELLNELEPVMSALNAPWELICVNDGSTDGTLSILERYASSHDNVRIISFTSNFGQSSAFDAGFKAAQGEFVLTLDADGQNDPHDIPKLVEAVEGADLVCGWRVDRKDTFFKKIISRCSNLIRGALCHDWCHDTGCSLKIYRTKCLQKITLYHGMHRFLPALFLIHDFIVTEVPVHHRPRTKGTSKYSIFNRSLAPIMDMFAVMWMRRRHLRYIIKKEQS
jgi:dolichol-phosphate mannosyltransferase